MIGKQTDGCKGGCFFKASHKYKIFPRIFDSSRRADVGLQLLIIEWEPDLSSGIPFAIFKSEDTIPDLRGRHVRYVRGSAKIGVAPFTFLGEGFVNASCFLWFQFCKLFMHCSLAYFFYCESTHVRHLCFPLRSHPRKVWK